MFNVCKGNTIIFPANPVSLAVPAIFYFNFKDAGNNHQWDIGGSVAAPQNVIGGNTTGSSILGSRCSTTAANPNGVQFIFGGDSTVSIGAANVELCAQHDPTDVNQEIAIYGLKETEGPPVLVNRYEAQSVCFGPGPDCSLISTGSQTGLAIHGTVYAPLARLDIMNVQTDPVTTYQVFSRGVIVRSLRTLMTPANACGALAPPLPEPCFPFQLPADRTGPTDVVFVAKVDNRVRVRAWVFFPGTGIAPQVQAWSVVNEP
jgi:hypothetical protein